MKRVDHFGLHTLIRPDKDGNWPMPMVEQSIGVGGEPRQRWDNDGYRNVTETKRKIPARRFETRLLAAAAKCYRGEIPLKELPKIPLDLANNIVREGGLAEWINSANGRLEKFWKMVDEQSRAALARQKSQAAGPVNAK